MKVLRLWGPGRWCCRPEGWRVPDRGSFWGEQGPWAGRTEAGTVDLSPGVVCVGRENPGRGCVQMRVDFQLHTQKRLEGGTRLAVCLTESSLCGRPVPGMSLALG